MTYARRLAKKLQYNGPVRLVLDAFRRIGIAFVPYYLMRETALAASTAKPANAEFKRLSRAEIRKLAQGELSYLTNEWVEKRFQLGDFCLALMKPSSSLGEPEAAAICWATRSEAILMLESVELKADEAYIYAAYTFDAYRGQGLMPSLRAELCTQLAAKGAKNMFSLVDALNRPARKVYEKMSASKVQLGIAISLFGVLNTRLAIKNYETGFTDR